jgi:retron-type reverse transcriptase
MDSKLIDIAINSITNEIPCLTVLEYEMVENIITAHINSLCDILEDKNITIDIRDSINDYIFRYNIIKQKIHNRKGLENEQHSRMYIY